MNRSEGIDPGSFQPAGDPIHQHALARFGKGVAHEVRNRLTVLRNVTYSLRGTGLVANERENLETALTAVTDSGRVLEAYLQFLDPPGATKGRVNPDRVLSSLLVMVENTLRRYHLRLEGAEAPRHLPPSSLPVGCLEELLVLMLDAVVDVLQPEGTVRISTESAMQSAVISFRGIPTGDVREGERRQDIAEHAALAEARRIVGLCGASLDVESSESAFELRLAIPVAEVETEK